MKNITTLWLQNIFRDTNTGNCANRSIFEGDVCFKNKRGDFFGFKLGVDMYTLISFLLGRHVAADPQTKPTDVGRESACELLSLTPAIAI